MSKQQRPQQSITVPPFTHSTIDTVLEINQHLIKILLEYQSNGYIGSNEHMIYHQRLHTNLTYLATLADAATAKTVDLTPVVYPAGMHQDTNSWIDLVSARSTKDQIMDIIPAPTMVYDPKGVTVKPDSSSYRPVPPFAQENEPVPNFDPVDPMVASEAMSQRFAA